MEKKHVFPPEGYLSIPGAATEIGCSLTTLYRWIKQEKLQVRQFRRYPASLEMGQAVKREDVQKIKQQLEQTE